MCIGSTPEIQTVETPPPVSYEEASPAQAEVTARRQERKRAKRAFNQMDTVLGSNTPGMKTILGD